jgi:hypothetical protein
MFETLCLQERHDAGDELAERRSQDAGGLVSKWRQKDKLKTTAVALVLCLNIGVDPPDVVKISPCARLECWVDPLSMQPAKALETIGVLLFTLPRSSLVYCVVSEPFPGFALLWSAGWTRSAAASKVSHELARPAFGNPWSQYD